MGLAPKTGNVQTGSTFFVKLCGKLVNESRMQPDLRIHILPLSGKPKVSFSVRDYI